MLVRRISPAPRRSASTAHSTASLPVGMRPPLMTTSHHPSGRRRASMATTTHWLPKRSAPSEMRSGLRTAALLMETLSAPACKMARMSSTVRMPPPTVKGMKTVSATRRTTSRMISRPSWVAEMSRKTSSSARSRS